MLVLHKLNQNIKHHFNNWLHTALWCWLHHRNGMGLAKSPAWAFQI